MSDRTMIGAYGQWAASLADDPGTLSLLNSRYDNTDEWRKKARERVGALLSPPEISDRLEPTVEAQYNHDGLYVEELSWELPYGPPTKAVFLKPSKAESPLPGVLGLHDHGGVKYFGRRKIVETPRLNNPLMTNHRRDSYGGRPWANALAKRGYAVLVHDAFAFASRRVRLRDVPASIREKTTEPSDDDPDTIKAYDKWAAAHESTMAKSLFSAGTTWPGVTLVEDQCALDVLCARTDVDASAIGCGGLSGGGLRTVYLAGLDNRIDSAVCAGMMTTWRDFQLHKSQSHTWMCYLPLCANDLDYSEILGLRVPAPTLVLNNREDPLFTVEEMRRADDILERVYEIAGANDRYKCSFYKGTHKFDCEMQVEAFDWFDKTLK